MDGFLLPASSWWMEREMVRIMDKVWVNNETDLPFADTNEQRSKSRALSGKCILRMMYGSIFCFRRWMNYRYHCNGVSYFICRFSAEDRLIHISISLITPSVDDHWTKCVCNSAGQFSKVGPLCASRYPASDRNSLCIIYCAIGNNKGQLFLARCHHPVGIAARFTFS